MTADYNIDVENVILIDAAFIDFIAEDIKRNFEPQIGRTLPKADLSCLATYLALDAGIADKDNSTDVIFVCDSKSSRLNHFLPSDIAGDGLNNKSFKDQNLGEFNFYTIQPEQMATREELFNETLEILLTAKSLKRIALIADEEALHEQIDKTLAGAGKNIEVTRFGMFFPDEKENIRKEVLAYPVMKSLGISATELR